MIISYANFKSFIFNSTVCMYPFRFNIVIYIPLPPFGSPHHLPQRIIKITLWNLVIHNPKLLSLLHTLKSSSGQLIVDHFQVYEICECSDHVHEKLYMYVLIHPYTIRQMCFRSHVYNHVQSGLLSWLQYFNVE
jgi:hypothetical protein